MYFKVLVNMRQRMGRKKCTLLWSLERLKLNALLTSNCIFSKKKNDGRQTKMSIDKVRWAFFMTLRDRLLMTSNKFRFYRPLLPPPFDHLGRRPLGLQHINGHLVPQKDTCWFQLLNRRTVRFFLIKNGTPKLQYKKGKNRLATLEADLSF